MKEHEQPWRWRPRDSRGLRGKARPRTSRVADIARLAPWLRLTTGAPSLSSQSMRTKMLLKAINETSVLPYCFRWRALWKHIKRPIQKRTIDQRLTGVPEEIRTPAPQIRSLVLYPAFANSILFRLCRGTESDVGSTVSFRRPGLLQRARRAHLVNMVEPGNATRTRVEQRSRIFSVLAQRLHVSFCR
jgi:hypothetical protein